MAHKRASVLFVLENDYYPRDMRVYNECSSLSVHYDCHVVAPRRRGEKWFEVIDSVSCYRYPHYEAKSLPLLFVEYLIAAAGIIFLAPLIVFTKGVRVVHIANPPDFIAPSLAWLKLFGVKIAFDVHDLSIETFKGKTASRTSVGMALMRVLRTLERLSILAADLVITTNLSIRDYIGSRYGCNHVCIVRNSNPIVFESVADVGKCSRSNEVINIGYFGILANDEAAGLDNFFVLADALVARGVRFQFSIVGTGPGLAYLQCEVRHRCMEERFRFYGFVGLPDAFSLIKNFDFGLVTWGDLSKNHLHTAMKVMDYMCCAVPVCSLNLKEQLASTQGIGVHAPSFTEIAGKIVSLSQSKREYEELRRRTLDRFNSALAWRVQEAQLIDAYRKLI